MRTRDGEGGVLSMSLITRTVGSIIAVGMLFLPGVSVVLYQYHPDFPPSAPVSHSGTYVMTTFYARVPEL